LTGKVRGDYSELSNYSDYEQKKALGDHGGAFLRRGKDRSMRAFVYEKAGVSRLQDFPAPSSKSGGAVVRVLSCSVCGTDLRAWQHGNERITPPRITGHELCGEIVDVGSLQKEFAVGDRISMAPAIGCGSCYPCSRGYTNLCDNLQTIGFQFNGGFSEYMEVPPIAFTSSNVYRTPAGVSDEEAALAEPIACVVNGQEFLHIGPGDTVAIFGSGFI
jgi:L-iditol 2-dehydrogenase